MISTTTQVMDDRSSSCVYHPVTNDRVKPARTLSVGERLRLTELSKHCLLPFDKQAAFSFKHRQPNYPPKREDCEIDTSICVCVRVYAVIERLRWCPYGAELISLTVGLSRASQRLLLTAFSVRKRLRAPSFHTIWSEIAGPAIARSTGMPH